MKRDCITRLIINVARVTIAYLKDRIELCHHVRVLITLVMETLKSHILNNIISNVNRSVNVVSAREKLEHSVGLEVLAEGETWYIYRHGWPGQVLVGSVGLTYVVLVTPYSERTGTRSI